MIVAHILGLPIEESVLEFAPAGAAIASAIAIAGRASLGRLRRCFVIWTRACGERPRR